MEASPTVSSQTEVVLPSTSTTPPILRLRLQKKKNAKKVVWTDGTVDNEHMNKKKSKCNGCCIYKKPLAFGESSSEEEEECEHCFGHPEKRKKSDKHKANHQSCSHNNQSEESCSKNGPHECTADDCVPKNDSTHLKQ